LKGAAINTIIEEVCKNTEIDIPKCMIDRKTEDVKAQFEQQIMQSGIDPKTYYEIMKQQNDGKNEADFDALFVEQAEHDVKQDLVLNKLMEVESFDVSDEEKEAEYENFAKAYNQKVEDFKKVLDEATENYIENFIKQRKLFDFLIENAKVKEEEKEEK
ncbi:MAG: trigger factor, partial [Anaerofustis stercorihominis]